MRISYQSVSFRWRRYSIQCGPLLRLPQKIISFKGKAKEQKGFLQPFRMSKLSGVERLPGPIVARHSTLLSSSTLTDVDSRVHGRGEEPIEGDTGQKKNKIRLMLPPSKMYNTCNCLDQLHICSDPAKTAQGHACSRPIFRPVAF